MCRTPLCVLRWSGCRSVYEPFVGIRTLLRLLRPSQPAGIAQRLGTLGTLLLYGRVGPIMGIMERGERVRSCNEDVAFHDWMAA